ncbi:MAG: NADH-quinone oxidoreductase subunit J [Bacteroidales bacterium]|nr:NADH-quinone oxidoreductase subunit J [Bacteroidales bacterium]
MTIEQILFYVISSLVLFFAFLVIICRRIFRSAIYLLFSLLGIAAIYFMMDVEFIAAIQIIVYVGGIVVLIIFSIFLTHQVGEKMPRKLLKRVIPAIILSLSGFLITMKIIADQTLSIATPKDKLNASVERIGLQLLDYKNYGYVLPFEIISFLLLAALIGSIVIAIRPRQQNIKN